MSVIRVKKKVRGKNNIPGRTIIKISVRFIKK